MRVRLVRDDDGKLVERYDFSKCELLGIVVVVICTVVALGLVASLPWWLG